MSQSSTMQKLAARVAALRAMSKAELERELEAAIARVDAKWAADSRFPPIFDRGEVRAPWSAVDESHDLRAEPAVGTYVSAVPSESLVSRRSPLEMPVPARVALRVMKSAVDDAHATYAEAPAGTYVSTVSPESLVARRELPEVEITDWAEAA